MNTVKLLALLFISSLAVGCTKDDEKDDHDHDSEEELITTVIYTLNNSEDNADVVTLTFTDLDGEGGMDGIYDVSGPLTANARYTGDMRLLNATESPAENITEEVEDEGDEHEFFYLNTAGLTITKTDVDDDGNPVGLKTLVTTGDAATGTITAILKHEPTKPNDGTTADAGGSTDVEVSFSIEVQ